MLVLLLDIPIFIYIYIYMRRPGDPDHRPHLIRSLSTAAPRNCSCYENTFVGLEQALKYIQEEQGGRREDIKPIK